jgi:hypothetical protein
MPHDPEAFADMVVTTVKLALAPVLADVKSLQAQLAGWDARWNDIVALRERVAVVETKAATVQPLEPVHVPVREDLAPVLERLAVAESRLAGLPMTEKALGDLRDRVVVVETKAVLPVSDPVSPREDLAPLVERVAAAEARLMVLGDVRDRVVAIETKAALPAADVDDLRNRMTALETTQAIPTAAEIMLTDVKQRLTALETREDPTAKELTVLRERVAVAEVKALVPGPPGKDGKDGVDGMGWDDLVVDSDGERTFTVKLVRGERVKDAGSFTVPFMIYRGVFQEGRSYKKGDMLTWAGSLWLVNEDMDFATSTGQFAKPDELSKAWTLCVKKGRDGRDGKDAPGAMPVVTLYSNKVQT